VPAFGGLKTDDGRHQCFKKTGEQQEEKVIGKIGKGSQLQGRYRDWKGLLSSPGTGKGVDCENSAKDAA